jgi:signal recognition particle receptor subunit beta
VPLLVMANKQDLLNAMSPDEVPRRRCVNLLFTWF